MSYKAATSTDGVGQATKRKERQQKIRVNTKRRTPLLLTFCGLAALACAIFVASKIEEFRALHRWGENMSSYTKSGVYGEKSLSVFPAPNGVEDITSIFDVKGFGELFIGAAEDRAKLWLLKDGDAEHAEDGILLSILVPVDPKEPPVVRSIKLNGRPEGVAFHPHGLYYLKETSELFVVNHAYGTEGEIVEIFHIEQINDPPHAKATFKSSLRVPAPLQSLNDLVAVSPHEIFITQCTHVGVPGSRNAGITRQALSMLNGLLLSLPVPSSLRPPIWRCISSTKGTTNENSFHKEKWTCAPVPGTAGRAIMYNGINVSKNKKTLMAADTIRRSIILFNREESGQLTFKEEIKLPFHPDNIEPVPMREGGEELFTIGVASFQETFEFFTAAHSASSMEELTSTGKVIHGGAIEFSLPEGGYKQQLLTFHDGFNGISCAVKAKNGVLLHGSWYSPGILVSRP